MALSDVREQIRTILSAVSGIGVIHEYQRWVKDERKLKEIGQDGNGKINLWMIIRKSTVEKAKTYGQNDRTFVFTIKGIYAVEDDKGTELIFQDLIENICAAFRSNYRLNSTVQSTYTDVGPLSKLGGVQVDLVDYRSFCGVLCHYCELGIACQTLVNR